MHSMTTVVAELILMTIDNFTPLFDLSKSMTHPLRIIGLDIETKTDVLALVAFLLSMISILFHVFAWIVGPRVTLLPPSQIILYTTAAPDTGARYISFVATMAYYNDGYEGYDDAVVSERLRFSLGAKEGYKAEWLKFVNFSEAKDFIEKGTTAGPVVVRAGSVELHETWFAAVDDASRVKWEEFRTAFEPALENENLVLTWELEFAAETLSNRKMRERCVVTLSHRRMQRVNNPNDGWVALTCENATSAFERGSSYRVINGLGGFYS